MTPGPSVMWMVYVVNPDPAVPACDPPPTTTPEEICASNLVFLSISAANSPSVEPPAEDGEDSLFIPEDSPPAPQPAQSSDSTQLENIEDTDKSTTGVASWSPGDRRLYRRFCEDVQTAEGQWDHPSTRQGMASLRRREPQLHQTFLRCLAIACKTMGEDVVDEWRRFQDQGWEKRQRNKIDTLNTLTTLTPNTASHSSTPPTVDPARREVVAAAYREFQEIFKAKTNSWKARFQYRRAAVGLTVQYDSYAKLRDKHSVSQPSAPQHDRSMLLRALFREMQIDWRNALPCNFTDKQAKDRGYASEWKALNRAIQDGRRWKVLVRDLGFGALLLIDTSGNVDYLQQKIPMPVFVAWAQLIPRVRLDVKEVAARVEGYYDGMEDPSYAARKLRPLKLERHAYRACSPGEQFEFSGSEGGKTPTADPNCLVRPSDAMLLDERAMEELMTIPSDLED